MDTRKFNYPAVFTSLPDYTDHAGQTVQVIRPLNSDEADGPEQGEEQMYEILASDGWIGHAWESELVDAS